MYFEDNEAVEMSPVSWLNQLPAIEHLFFFEGGVDRFLKTESLRRIEAGLASSKLEVIWHKSKSSSHIVFGLRCRDCGYMVAAEWGSPHKYLQVKQKVNSLQVAFAYWLGIELPETLSDGPRTQ